MAKKVAIELWACIDTCGDYGLGKDAESARENYEENIQPLCDCDGFRLVKVTVQVPLPQVAELVGEACEEESASLACVA